MTDASTNNWKQRTLTTLMLVIATSIVTSVLTSITVLYLNPVGGRSEAVSISTNLHSTGNMPNINCTQGVYSPVQNTCVSQTVFDQEMKNIFTALGLKTDIYHQSEQPENE